MMDSGFLSHRGREVEDITHALVICEKRRQVWVQEGFRIFPRLVIVQIVLVRREVFEWPKEMQNHAMVCVGFIRVIEMSLLGMMGGYVRRL